jgi:hypothetical protein
LKSRRFFTAVALAVLAALVFALPASTQMLAQGTGGERPLATLETFLTGEKEVPGPGDPDGFGRAVVKVFEKKVCFTLEVRRIAPATGAHIHLGLRDEAGPVVAALDPPPTDGSSSGCVDIPRALSLELREHPSRYYINVHNADFPDGAIRGQLHRR